MFGDEDLEHSATLRGYRILPLKELLSKQALFNAGINPTAPEVKISLIFLMFILSIFIDTDSSTIEMRSEEVKKLSRGLSKRKVPSSSTDVQKKSKALGESSKEVVLPTLPQEGAILVSPLQTRPSKSIMLPTPRTSLT